MRCAPLLILMCSLRLAAQPIDTSQASVRLTEASVLIGHAQYDSAIAVLEPLMVRADSARWAVHSAKARHQLSVALNRTGRFPEANLRVTEALAAFTALGDTGMMAKAEADIAFGLKQAMRAKDALPHNERALELYAAIHDTVGMAITLNNISAARSDMGDLDAAEEPLRRSYALLKAGGRPELRKTITVMAQLAERRGDRVTAIAYADTAITMHRAADDTRGAARTLGFRARSWLKAGRPETALTDAREAQRLTNDPLYLLEPILIEARALKALGRPREALPRFAEAERMALRVGNIALGGMASMEQADLLSALGEHQAANAKLLHYMHIQDSCRVESSTREVTRAEMNMAFAKEHLADSLANIRTMELAGRDHAIQLAGERHRSVLLAVCAASVLLLAAVLWSRLRYVRRTRDTILRTQQRLVESERQREAEQVRTRIARDVHDEIGSELTKINLLVAQKRAVYTGDLPADALEDVAELAQNVSASLNDVVWAVDPRNDTIGSLLLHAQHFTERSLQHHPSQAHLRFKAEGQERTIDPARKRDLFLVLKEALNNAMKYSGARNIRVDLSIVAERFSLELSDDGAGFDPAAHTLEGNGLRNMRARAEAMGAALELRSAPGAGCTVLVTGPLV